MARYYVNQNSHLPFHITSRCPNREPFRLSLDAIWNITSDHLYLSNKKYEFLIHAYVLMPNHFHLIASSPCVKIGEVMRDFMTETSREINRLSSRINQNWGGRHYKCVLDNPIHLINTYKYVYQNPVRAGLCSRVENWKYSTLHGLLGASRITIPIVEDTVLFRPHFLEEELEWLNRRIDHLDCESIRGALKKRSFKLPKTFQKLHYLQNNRV